ncbi:MAG: DNA repair protein RecN [Jatrophihabitantaceae bacterium]
MLEELRIRGLGVIEEAVLPLGPGLTVVTGETGAGKTMVVTGLLLLFGARADVARVRAGVEQASVEGSLEIEAQSPSAERVREAGGELDDGTGLVLRRTVTAAGRSRAHVGGAAVPVAVLAALAEGLLAMHGQADQQRLTRPAEQRAALDRFAQLDLSGFATSYASWRAADRTLRERTEKGAELRREAELLSHGIAEIETAAPEPGEDVALNALAVRLAHADGLRLAARFAHDVLLGNADTPMADAADVTGLLGAAARALGQQSGADPQLDSLAERVTELSTLAEDLGAELGACADQLDADPARLEQVQHRRAVLAGLVRKYAPAADLDSVLRWAADAQQRLATIDVSGEAMAALVARRDAAAERTAALATQISATRHAAAAELANAVTAELSGLAMPGARMTIEVRPHPMTAGAPRLVIGGTELAVTAEGTDEVVFLLRPRPDAPALAVARGASGGELSRVMLALEVCLAASDPVPIMVFDEIDAGVGGRAAVEVGRRLARLARDRQVIVVTHLAQVAAYAERHVVVDKPVAGERSVTASDVRTVSGADRVSELARMLAGSGSATALEHAAELLANAARDQPVPEPRPVPNRRRKAVKSRS